MHSLKMSGCKTIIYDDIAQERYINDNYIFKNVYFTILCPFFMTDGRNKGLT